MKWRKPHYLFAFTLMLWLTACTAHLRSPESIVTNTTASDLPEAAPPAEFESYAVVLLRKGPAWSSEYSEENRRLMRQHLGHFAAMADAGKLPVLLQFQQLDSPLPFRR